MSSNVSENTNLWESVKIIFDDKYLDIYNDMERNPLTLNDALKIAKENGYKEGTILVLSESYLCGAVYRYNNYNEKEWIKVGSLIGFA